MKNTEENDETYCVILDKCIYGTVQAAREWAKMFEHAIQELDFEVNMIDPCLMHQTNNQGTVVLCISVDDVLLLGEKEAIDQYIIYAIEGKFDIRKERTLKDYLGYIIKFTDKEGSIHQPHSLKKLERNLKEIWTSS